ncbi:hypothetical protein [Planomonospora sp. ID82291]|uniref:hypothetical protein n=1 Tax=Planomonospora sp. ID82291 TaxID=2738136 RepID=UPI0018C3EDF8|nr:hypothetical protein [Planomonospora sp. ID82291]MBG0818914.1 hypothetical protein [Planomonospora sp. ID82291]
MPVIAPLVNHFTGGVRAMPTYLPAPGAGAYFTPGAVVPIPAEALPAELVDRAPVDAVVTRDRRLWGVPAYVAAAPIHHAAFLSFRWDAETGQVADVACWPSEGEADRAAYNLARTVSAPAKEGKPLTHVTVTWGGIGGRRVIGPAWGGTLTRGKGGILVRADFRPEPVGTASTYRTGARLLARHHGVPARGIALDVQD